MNAFNAEIVKQTADQDAYLNEATQRAVAAELDAAHLRATIEEKDQELRELRELRKHARAASRQQTVIDRRWQEHVDALLVEVRKFAKIYGVDEALDGKIEQAEDELLSIVPQSVAALITEIRNDGATLVVKWPAKGPEGSMTQSMEIPADAGRDKIQPRIPRSSTS